MSDNRDDSKSPQGQEGWFTPAHSLSAEVGQSDLPDLELIESSNLAARLRQQIKSEGPITFHDWMAAALYDERDGYYRRTDRVRQGRAGDYRTAPETSPLFGATFAGYFAKCYQDLGWPDTFTILEVGGGRGDFAHAVLTTLKSEFSNVFAVTRYVVDEIGGARHEAAQRLNEFSEHVEFRARADIDTPFSGVIFSNELLDAFPVHRVIGSEASLRELYIDVDQSGPFVWTSGDLDPQVARYCEQIDLQLKPGQIYEVNLAASEFVARAAALIDRGSLISVDYGATRAELLSTPNRFAGTLRAFHRHRMPEDVLSDPGEQDLTTTVDWTQIAAAGKQHGLETLRLETLDHFLLAQDILGYLSAMSVRFTATESLRFNAAARELFMPDSLGSHFQVLVQRKVSSGS